MNDSPRQIEPKKSLGQHFLNNPRIPEKMADAAHLAQGDTILEIGPGTGALTKTLLERGARVVGLEADLRAIEVLKETFTKELANGDFTLIHRDIRDGIPPSVKLTEHAYKVVANIPYYLSGRLFRTFLESDTQPSALVFLVQKEIAERICRDPKESLLSLSVKAFGNPRYIHTVSRGNFTPSPKVDSAIIAVSDISHEKFEDLDQSFFFRVLHIGFKAKRKQLLSQLTEVLDRHTLMEIFDTLDLRYTVRGEDASIENWINLARNIASHTDG